MNCLKDIEKLFRLRDEGWSVEDLAELFGVHEPTIERVLQWDR